MELRKREPELRMASIRELRQFYHWMERQFHADELKPLSQLEWLTQQERYASYGLWDGEELIAYAMFGIASDCTTMLLDYFAVLPQYQGAGWGTRFLTALRARGGGPILLEVEDPVYAPNELEAALRRRRVRFYVRNGCFCSSVEVNLYGFDYIIMTLARDTGIADAKVRPALEDIYSVFFTPQQRAEHVHFREPGKLIV